MLVFDDDSNVGAVATIMGAGDTDNVAVFKPVFYRSNFVFRDHVHRHFSEPALLFVHLLAKIWIVFEIAIAFPQDGHFLATVVHSCVWKRPSEVFYITALVVIGIPFCEVMYSIEVVAVTLTVAIASPLDLFQQVLGLVGVFRCVEHSTESETYFEKSPTV